MFQRLGWPELIILLIIVLLIFGPSKLPQLAKSIGQAIHDFRENLAGEQGEAGEEPGDEPKQE
jgi:sec-independent protein translocase protein TatA